MTHFQADTRARPALLADNRSRRSLLTGIAVALSAIPLTTLADAIETADPDEMVFSDSTRVPPVEVSRTFLPSFPGRAEAGKARDALAEFRSVRESSEELASLFRLKPMTPPTGQESIIGTDSRTLVSITTAYPARATVLITFSAGRCTGWLIGANTVITAGHCVHPGAGGTFYPASTYVIYPGRNGTTSPYGACSARWLASVAAWTNTSDNQYDYGAIKLNCEIGNTTGWYGIFWQTATLTGLPTVINGYPGDKPLTQWRSTGTVTITQAQLVFYKNDTEAGQSGSPVWYNRAGCGVCAMAVHTSGVYGGPPFSTNNHGTRITQPVYNNLVAWKNAP